MPTRLRRAEQVERNRELVLAAAQRVFVARGYAGATLEAIADEAGFSKGVVYSQFGSKPDLFFALLEQRIEHRAAHHRQAVAGLRGLDAFEALLRAGDEDAHPSLGGIRADRVPSAGRAQPGAQSPLRRGALPRGRTPRLECWREVYASNELHT